MKYNSDELDKVFAIGLHHIQGSSLGKKPTIIEAVARAVDCEPNVTELVKRGIPATGLMLLLYLSELPWTSPPDRSANLRKITLDVLSKDVIYANVFSRNLIFNSIALVEAGIEALVKLNQPYREVLLELKDRYVTELKDPKETFVNYGRYFMEVLTEPTLQYLPSDTTRQNVFIHHYTITNVLRTLNLWFDMLLKYTTDVHEYVPFAYVQIGKNLAYLHMPNFTASAKDVEINKVYTLFVEQSENILNATYIESLSLRELESNRPINKDMN